MDRQYGEKLIHAVCMHKAYKKSAKTMQEKFTAIKADLLANKEFELFREKNWETYKSKWATIIKNFKAKYAFEGEGANLSCLDPSKPNLFVGHEKILFDICYEIAHLEADKEELSKKQKETNKSMLRHEGQFIQQNQTVTLTTIRRRCYSQTPIVDELVKLLVKVLVVLDLVNSC